MILVLLLVMTLFVAYSNGANDNFKGVATVFGSGAATYKAAITLATVSTLAGSVCSVVLAGSLVKAFSGKGLVPDAVAASPHFLLAVSVGAGCTVLLATVLGFPVSTTHGLTGALVGAGLVAAGPALHLGKLGGTFVAPLLLGPLLSVSLTVPVYGLLRRARVRLGVGSESCLCAGETDALSGSRVLTDGSIALVPSVGLTATVGPADRCKTMYTGRVLGVSAQRVLDAAHFASAGTVSFARGLNDTPKIVGLLFLVEALDVRLGIVAVALAMAMGGLLNARKVAETMSHRIARMNDGQAFAANLVTGFLVLCASRLGLPVSTTHVSVGAITGVGIVNGSAARGVLSGILLSWVLTLPVAALLSALTFSLISSLPLDLP